MAEEEKKKSKHSLVKVIAGVVGGLILIAALIVAIYFYLQYQKEKQLLQNPTLAAQQQSQQIITAVGKLMELPSNEQPTIATVSDVKKLADQPFFAHAANGDKVLIYTQSKQAILYSPTLNKIIAVAPLNIAPVPSVSPSPSPKAKK